MAEQYTHTLIAVPKDFIPASEQVGQFISAMLDMRVVPGMPEVSMYIPSGKSQERPNPFGAGVIIVEAPGRGKTITVESVADEIRGLHDYRVWVTGVGHPKTPPVPIDFAKPYAVTVGINVSSTLRITSDRHDLTGPAGWDGLYRHPFTGKSLTGQFHNPRDGSVIKVPKAGAARFWIEFELGKFLFPEINGSNLDLLNPAVAAAAEEAFGIQFVQGCYWG